MTCRSSESARYQILERTLLTPTSWTDWYHVRRHGKEWIAPSGNNQVEALEKAKSQMTKLKKRNIHREYKISKIRTIIITEDVE